MSEPNPPAPPPPPMRYRLKPIHRSYLAAKRMEAGRMLSEALREVADDLEVSPAASFELSQDGREILILPAAGPS